jgi:hypothetical protein
LRQNPHVGFTLAGFDERDGTAPSWMGHTESDDLADAITDAEAWIAGRAEARVDVVHVVDRIGRVVVSVTLDGVETLASVQRVQTADDVDLLRQARRREVTVNSVTFRRRWRSTVFTASTPLEDVVASIDRELGVAVDGGAAGNSGGHFTYSRGQIEQMGGFNVLQGVHATGTVAVDGLGSRLTVTFRPTLGSASWIAFSLMATLAGVYGAVVSAVEQPFELWTLAGIALFGGTLAMFSWISAKHRRATDIEILRALAVGQRPRQVPRRRRRRPRRDS